MLWRTLKVYSYKKVIVLNVGWDKWKITVNALKGLYTQSICKFLLDSTVKKLEIIK